MDIAKIQKRIDEEYYEDMDALEKVRVLYYIYLFGGFKKMFGVIIDTAQGN